VKDVEQAVAGSTMGLNGRISPNFRDHYALLVSVYFWPYFLLLDDLLQVQAFMLKHGTGLLRHVTAPLNPDYTDSEKEIITWLMNNRGRWTADHYTLFIECQVSPYAIIARLGKHC
jgi:hypothetical protein